MSGIKRVSILHPRERLSDMELPQFTGIGHLDLSVSDIEESARWYEQVLGLRRARRVDFEERTMIVLLHQPTGLVIGLNQHMGHPGEQFDERRSGLDHVGFAVERRDDLDAWQARFASLDVVHSPVADTEVGSALVFRDPDHIQLEMWWSRPRDEAGSAQAATAAASPGSGLLYHSS
jgi:catechol-2,3-dioxygenase